MVRGMSASEAAGSSAPFTGRTAWARNLALPMRQFLEHEAGSATVLLAACLAALAWSNVAASSYDAVWGTSLELRVGRWALEQDARAWVNDGLMTFFFFVVGLEARRELDMGELRARSRAALPFLAGLCGMAVPILVYLAVNRSSGAASGWGVAMSTDTAFALGVLALVGRHAPDRLRVFLLTVVVADDLAALVVIAAVYTEHLAVGALAVAAAIFGLIILVRAFGVRHGGVYLVLGVAAWVAMFESGIDPLVVGLVMGLLTYAYPAIRTELERAIALVRSFREQPTPELARSARRGLEAALSPNERLQTLFHPWTSYAIVPLFALANAGVPVTHELLQRAARSPVTIGIVLAYVAGKPLGILAGSWLGSRGLRTQPPAGWAPLGAVAASAGIGFTVSLLIASKAFSGARLEEAKAGVLLAAALAATLSWLTFRVIALLPQDVRVRQLHGASQALIDLRVPVDPDRDHIRGREDAPVTLVEYGDFECPYCGQAEPVVRALLADFGDDLRYVWRHLPLADVHPNAQLAAEASEAAGAQGRFWDLHDVLLTHQRGLRPPNLLRYADDLGLDVDRFSEDLRRHVHRDRVAEDVDGADLSGVSGTPTFFVNGRRQHGAYDVDTLTRAVRAARARARLEAAAGQV